MSFSHSPVGGQGNLVATQIQSPNFEHGIQGWRIAKDGSAEFQDVILPTGSGGAVVYFQATAPVNPNVGDVWFQI